MTSGLGQNKKTWLSLISCDQISWFSKWNVFQNQNDIYIFFSILEWTYVDDIWFVGPKWSIKVKNFTVITNYNKKALFLLVLESSYT